MIDNEVWVALQGEPHEGGRVLGVFATREAAVVACADERAKGSFEDWLEYTIAAWPVREA